MKEIKTDLKFNFQSLLSNKIQQSKDSIDSININLPYISFSIKPKNKEKIVAKEIIIRLSDKRILNNKECCNDCIRNAVISLNEIRQFLVNKQIDLMDYTNSSLYLLIEMILESIRQFFTYIEKYEIDSKFNNSFEKKEIYFGALELLRSHIYRCLIQISKIASVNIPKISYRIEYNEKWELNYYTEIKQSK
ncbi:MAG: hypothetical protein M1479_00115 [Actinobacteria bacterium]|nr:hypothetical protein [Actinomycetota bacterium]